MGPTKFSPGGLAAVWATQNTRAGIFDALSRREAFSTSGPRIRIRFFGGFELPENTHERRNAVAVGYRKGVPMGGDLRSASQDKAPRFFVWAAQDPESARLAKIQVVKGWVEEGIEQSRVYDVVCSDGATPDAATRRCPDNGAAVDLETCALVGAGGDAMLATTWADPDFDASRRRGLLREGPGEPRLSMEHARRVANRCPARKACPRNDPGTRLDLADLVHA